MKRYLVAALTVVAVALPGTATGATDSVTRVNPPEHRGSPTDHRGESFAIPPTPPATPAVESSGFDWGDAAIGAGAVVALGLIAFGSVAMVVARTRVGRASSTHTVSS